MKLTKIYPEVTINGTEHDTTVLILKADELLAITHQLDMARFKMADASICLELYEKIQEAYRTSHCIWV